MKKSSQQIENTQIDQLKSIRKEKKMSVESVAGIMKVSKDFVNFIESSQFEKLGAPTFLRGHITNYCKAIGIEPAVIINQVPEQYLKHQNLQTSNAMGASPLARVRRQSNHVGKYAIGTALLGMLCLSFYFVWDKWSLPRDEHSVNNIAITAVDDEEDKKITYSSLIPQVTGPVQSTPTTENDLNQDEDEVTRSVTEEVEDEAVDEGIIDELENQQLLVDEAQTDSIDYTISSKYAIRLNLKEQAWVSIKTQEGQSIIQDLLQPGTRKFQSDEPIKFRIGNAQQIQLYINNESIELAPHTDKDVADFVWPLDPNS